MRTDKQILLTLCILISSLFLLSASRKDQIDRLRSSRAKLVYINHGIAVQVDEEDGRFNMGTADGRALIYRYPSSPGTSHTNFLVDGILYSNAGLSVGGIQTVMVMSPIIRDTSIVCSWNINGLIVTQKLTPVEIVPGLGSIFIQYYVTNPTGQIHTIGILLEMDTMIDDNDRAPIATWASVSLSDIKHFYSRLQY